MALFVAGVTAIASKNLPGLMEIAVLQRITLQPGSRYAINTLLRYVVVTIGAIAVLDIVGWNWSQIQWLVAALSVGLGFGLQEIVANFVSGLGEMKDSVFPAGYLERVRKYCPSIALSDLLPYPAGIRAQAVKSDGSLVHDFLFAESARSIHVCNAPSPAATSALTGGTFSWRGVEE